MLFTILLEKFKILGDFYVERFGLFNLLKTFLPDSDATPEKTETSAVQDAPEPAPVPEGNERENAVETPNACAEFLARHDARKKRLGK